MPGAGAVPRRLRRAHRRPHQLQAARRHAAREPVPPPLGRSARRAHLPHRPRRQRARRRVVREPRHPAAPRAAQGARRRHRRGAQPSAVGHGVGVAAASAAGARPDVGPRRQRHRAAQRLRQARRRRRRSARRGRVARRRQGRAARAPRRARRRRQRRAGLRALHEPRMAVAHGVARRSGRRCRAHARGGVAAARAGIDRRGYPGLFEAMARQEIQLDPRVLDEG